MRNNPTNPSADAFDKLSRVEKLEEGETAMPPPEAPPMFPRTPITPLQAMPDSPVLPQPTPTLRQTHRSRGLSFVVPARGFSGHLRGGADPVGHAIMRTAGDQGRAIDTFVVRKAQKSYGMGRQVEGPSVVGRDVVVVEDTSTTGGSALTAVEGLQKAGANVVAVAIIVDRATGAKERIEESAGVPCLYAYSKDELGLD